MLPSPLARPGESERSQVNTCGLPITNRGKPGLRAGDLVAVQGIGGLGHLGVQFARHMGFHTVAIGRGREKEKLAKDLGAHVYIETAVDDACPLPNSRTHLESITYEEAMSHVTLWMTFRRRGVWRVTRERRRLKTVCASSEAHGRKTAEGLFCVCIQDSGLRTHDFVSVSFPDNFSANQERRRAGDVL